MDTFVGLASLAAGALLGGVVRVVSDRFAAFSDSKGVANGLKAEIASLIKLMEARNYGPRIADIIGRVSQPEHAVVPQDVLSVRATQDYFVVFRAVMGKVGLLRELGVRVIFWYSLARAVVEDAGELREHRQAMLDKRLVPSRDEVIGWHQDFGRLLEMTLADGASLLPELERFTNRRFLKLFR